MLNWSALTAFRLAECIVVITCVALLILINFRRALDADDRHLRQAFIAVESIIAAGQIELTVRDRSVTWSAFLMAIVQIYLLWWLLKRRGRQLHERDTGRDDRR